MGLPRWTWSPRKSMCSGLGHRLQGALGRAGRDRDAELRVEDAGGGLLVGVRVDARREPHQHRLRRVHPGSDGLEDADLVDVVDDDAADTGLDGEAQLVQPLVVAVEGDGRHVDAGGAQHGDLAARDRVEAVALGGDELGEGAIEKRLGGVDGVRLRVLRAERVEEPSALRAQRRVVVGVEGGAVLAGERGEVAATDGERALVGEGGADGKHVGERQCRLRRSHQGSAFLRCPSCALSRCAGEPGARRADSHT